MTGTAAFPLIAAVTVQAIGNLVFHAAVGRWLSAGDYGALGAVLAAMVMLGVPLGALQAAASAHVAGKPAARGTSVRVLRDVGMATLPPAALITAATGWVQGYFDLGSRFDAAQLGPYLVVSALLATARGLLLGRRNVPAVAVTYVLGTAVRLAVGLALVGRYGVSGALLGTLAGEVVSLLVAIVPLLAAGRHVAGTGRLRIRAVSLAAIAVTGLFLLSTVDLLLARHHLRGAVSGQYVAAATVAKAVLAIPAAIISVVFPRLVTAWAGGQHRARTLAAGAATVVGPALLGAAVVIAVPGPLLRLLYGDGFTSATNLVRALSAIAACTGVVTLLTYAALARGAWTIAVPWAGAIVEIAAIESSHATAAEVAMGSASALAPTLLVFSLLEARAWRRGPPRTTQFEPDRADHDDTSTGLAPAR